MLCVICSAQLHTMITEKLSKYRGNFSCCRLFFWFSWYRFLYWSERNRKSTKRFKTMSRSTCFTTFHCPLSLSPLPSLPHNKKLKSPSQCFYDQYNNMWDYWIHLKELISESLTVNSLILASLTAPWWIKGINCTMFSFLTASDCVIETNITYREINIKIKWV